MSSAPRPSSAAVLDTIRLFTPAEGLTYLDSATYGLPPRPTVAALREAARLWAAGTADWIADWDREGEVCRASFARLISAAAAEISLMPAVSVATAIVASAVPAGGEVLLAEGDFTSVVYPFREAERRGRLRVREAPLPALAEAVSSATRLVAVSHVQSADGAVADLGAIGEAARRCGAYLFVDASQSLGVVPLSVVELGVDFLACAAYKWLCCPRGVAFLFVRRDLWDELSPVAASWRAGDDPYGRYYGSPLALAGDAARFDVSLAWHAWVGARRSLEVLASIDDATRFDLALAPARRLAEVLDLTPPESGIVAVPVGDGGEAHAALAAAGVKVSHRAGQVRVSSHFYNPVDDAELAARVLAPFVRRRVR